MTSQGIDVVGAVLTLGCRLVEGAGDGGARKQTDVEVGAFPEPTTVPCSLAIDQLTS